MIPLALYYIRWHYSHGVTDLIGIVRNFLWFFYEFFSIPLLLKTFFVPFHRLAVTATQGFHPEEWFEAFIVTTLMRIVGAFMRTLLIVLGLALMLATLLIGLGVLVVWLMAPLFVFILISSGVTLFVAG
jgi:hypothetical protein